MDYKEFYKDDDRVDFETGRISINWYAEDVDAVAYDNGYVFEPALTEDEKMDVLLHVLRKHDANEGVTWNTLDFWLTELYGDRIKKRERA